MNKKSISSPFPVYEILKFNFRFSLTAPKDAEFNFRGSHKGDYQDKDPWHVPQKLIFDLFGKKNASSYGDC